MSSPSTDPKDNHDEIERLKHLLCCADEEYDDDPDALPAVVAELGERGFAVVLKVDCDIEDAGGYSVWGTLHKKLLVGDEELFVWSQRFTAEAVPPQRSFLCYYERDPEGLPVHLERLEELDGLDIQSNAPTNFDDLWDEEEDEYGDEDDADVDIDEGGA